MPSPISSGLSASHLSVLWVAACEWLPLCIPPLSLLQKQPHSRWLPICTSAVDGCAPSSSCAPFFFPRSVTAVASITLVDMTQPDLA